MFVTFVTRPMPFLNVLGTLEKKHGPLTAIRTLALAIFTSTLWWATGRLDGHDLQIDRACISGGDPGNSPHDPFVLTVNNYGRTPATLTEYAVEFCELNEIAEVKDIWNPATTDDDQRYISAGNHA